MSERAAINECQAHRDFAAIGVSAAFASYQWRHPLQSCILSFVIAVFVGSWAGAEEPLTQSVESGPVKVELELKPAEPLIGDAVALTITVTAEKDVEVLMPEFGEALERFSIIDFVPRESIDNQGHTCALQKYRLQPPSSGPQAIPPILIEYVDRRDGHRSAPKGLDAYEIMTDRLEFTVKSVLPSDARAELRPPLGQLLPRRSPATGAWLWIFGVGIALVLLSPFAIRRFLAWRRRARRRSAYEIAIAQLTRLLAKARPTDEEVDAFYVDLSGIVRRYLEDRFELRAPELTTEEFMDLVAESPELSVEHQSLLVEFLRRADLVKFAGARPADDDIDRSVGAARRFLDETKEAADSGQPLTTATRS